MPIERKPGKKLSVDAYVFAALAVLSFSILLFSTRSFVIDIRDTGLSVFGGVRGRVHTVTSFITRSINALSELSALREDYTKLLERMARYEELERRDAEIRQENYRLREQLGFARTLQYTYISAEITGRDPDNLFQALVINKGTVHGVRKDMAVVAYQDGAQALAGKILQAGRRESLMLPLYNERSFAAARFAQSRYEGIVKGIGGESRNLLMQFIDRRARGSVSKGDIVITSGMGGVYPAGINIGRVNAILSESGDSAFEIELEAILDFARLEYVFVLEKNE